jgi:arylsulfatase A-like enzyme
MSGPNILLIMTDEERYPPPYEDAGVAEFRRTQMPARERIRTGGLELHRHYAGSTACAPSRATLFSGQYPSLHGVSKTDGTAKAAPDPAGAPIYFMTEDDIAVFEMHNLSADPEERHNLAGSSPAELSHLTSVRGAEHDAKRLLPSLRNP